MIGVAGVARRGLARTIQLAAGARVVTPDGTDSPDWPGQAIFYANHSSHLDFITLWAVLPPRLRQRVRPVAAKDYWGTGVKRRLAEGLFNAHLVERHRSGDKPQLRSQSGVSPTASQQDGGGGSQIDDLTALLDAGDSVIIFPEGTRGDGEQVARFHSGLFLLAEHAPSVPVVPVTLRNLARILPKGAKIPVPHLATVVVHDPIRVDPGEERRDFLTRARQILIDGLEPDDENDGGSASGDDGREQP